MLLNIYNTVLTVGTTSDDEFERDNRKIISTNLAALLISLSTIPFVFYYYYLGLQDLSGLLIIIAFLSCHTIILNYWGFVFISKLWFIVVINFSGFLVSSLLGKESDIHYMFLSFCTLPFLIFELKNVVKIFAFVLISILMFFFIEFGYIDLSLFPLDEELQNKIYFPTILASVDILLITMFYFSYTNEAAENRLYFLKEKFELEIQEARNVIYQSAYEESASIAEVLVHQINELHASKDFLNTVNNGLRKTNSELDTFIYKVSHDLKYPISNIEGLLNVIIEHPATKDDDFISILGMISKSVARFKNTIGELTEITKLHINDEETTSIDLQELLNEVVLSLKDQIEIAGVKILFSIDSSITILFSRNNLRSVLFNLISNAIKYRSSERAPEVIIYTSIKNEFIEIKVKDNGIGIPDKHIYKIFTMFKRLHDHVEGSGVGLYLVKRIVDNSGGWIEVESEVDKGSEFKVFLKSTKIS